MNITYRKSITTAELYNFISTINNLFVVPDKIDSLDKAHSIIKSKTLFLEDKSIVVKPVTNSAEYIVCANAPFCGIATANISSLPLENKKITQAIKPTTEDSTIIITKTDDNYSGLNSVSFKNIAISSNINYTLLPKDIDGTVEHINKKIFNFHVNNEAFGAKNFTLDIPVIKQATLKATPQTVGAEFTPAAEAAGITGKGSNTAPICIQAVALDAARTDFTNADYLDIAKTVDNTVLIKADTRKDEAGQNCIAFKNVTINPADKSAIHRRALSSFWNGQESVIKTAAGCSCIHKLTVVNLPGKKEISTDITAELTSLLHNEAIYSVIDSTTTQDSLHPIKLQCIFADMADNSGIITTNTFKNTKATYSVPDFKNANYDFLKSVKITLPQLKDKFSNYIQAFNAANTMFEFNNGIYSVDAQLDSPQLCTYTVDFNNFIPYFAEATNTSSLTFSIVPSKDTKIGVDLESTSINITDAIEEGLITASTNNPSLLKDYEIPAFKALNITLTGVPKSHTTATWATVGSTNYETPYLFAESECSTTIEINSTSSDFYQYTQLHGIKEPTIPSDFYITSTNTSNSRIFTPIDSNNAITIPFETSVALVYCKGSIWSSSGNVSDWFPQWENIERDSRSCSEGSIKLPIRYYESLEKALDDTTTTYDHYSITLPHICSINPYKYNEFTLNPDTSLSIDLSSQAPVFASQLCKKFSNGWTFYCPGASSQHIEVTTSNSSSLTEAFSSEKAQVFILSKRVDSSLKIYPTSIKLNINDFFSNTFSFNSSNYILDIGMPLDTING